MTDYPELVVHIGPGKTGSTSIQRLLEAQRETLMAQGVAWLGVGLEHCQTSRPRDWQQPARIHWLLQFMSPAEAKSDLQQVLREELDRLAAAGFRRAVWSHEALFEFHPNTAGALQGLRDAGVTVRLLAYMRRYDDWIQSAYAQWGIRHKTYDGPVQSFGPWADANPPRFADHLQVWDTAFGAALVLRNYDSLPDVTADLLDFIGVAPLPAERSYATPEPSLLAAWGIHNSRVHAPRPPNSLGLLLEPSEVLAGGLPHLPPLEQMFPDPGSLARVIADSRADIDAVNAILVAKGSPPLPTMARSEHLLQPPETWDMLQLAMTMIFSLQEQVNALRSQIDDLTNP